MSFKRHKSHRDDSEPDIVTALEKAGWAVYRELPVDLLCLRCVGQRVEVRMLECKTPTKTGKRRKRKDQPEQDAFIARYDVPVVLTPFDALFAVGEQISL